MTTLARRMSAAPKMYGRGLRIISTAVAAPLARSMGSPSGETPSGSPSSRLTIRRPPIHIATARSESQ
ncbi:MAG: hypothetical protein BWY06_02723 [Candidatus Latescibacteria bacterium ADurb.Bin168]|nr:MAG: hypothetical protein BWY06_02723 [Candidatus Latescibacteria bacterium ADurb.Bin168]